MMTRNSKLSKEQNRAQFPFTSAIVDELREAGFTDCTVAFATENGNTIGKELPQGVQPVIQKRKKK
jgi:hypothetical protein